MTVRAVGLVALALAGCAATGVTLRSNHYRVYVPPGWQVVEPGGDSGIPTLLRVPPGDGAPALEVRLYAWLAQGPISDPTADALQRLQTEDVLGLRTATADDEQPCDEHAGTFVVFGRPARAVHVRNSGGQRIIVTAGYDNGSLVGVVGIAPAGPSACSAVDSPVKRLVSLMAGTGDTTRPIPSPTILDDPNGRGPLALPPADPGRLPP